MTLDTLHPENETCAQTSTHPTKTTPLDVSVTVRTATPSDLPALLLVAHRARTRHAFDFATLERQLEDVQTAVKVVAVGEVTCGMITMQFDRQQGLCKLTRLLASPELADGRAVLRDALHQVLEELRQTRPEIEVVYTTTTSVSLDEQGVSLECGFHICGVFPNLLGMDSSQLNGLTARFLNDRVRSSRPADLVIHPVIKPFFEIARRECGLPEAQTSAVKSTFLDSERGRSQSTFAQPPAADPDTERDALKVLDSLEVITARGFVGHRFRGHIEKHSQMTHFYPFYEPNTLISDPELRCEVFAKVIPDKRFAAIIGEHLAVPLDPVRLYDRVQALLKEGGTSYIEIINDAADVLGTEAILQAGFTPCAYFPAFKRQGVSRRDFVVFGKSFEYLCRPDFHAPRAYLDFYREYFRIEGRNYFPDRS